MTVPKTQKKASTQKPPHEHEVVFAKTPIGILAISGTKEGISKVAIARAHKKNIKVSKILQAAKKEIEEYFYNGRKKLSFPIIFEGSKLEKAVWKKLQSIPHGNTVSYKELAHLAGYPKAVRAVASAVGRNNILVRIPCHRVIASNGKIGGFSAGIRKKVVLLKHEKNRI